MSQSITWRPLPHLGDATPWRRILVRTGIAIALAANVVLLLVAWRGLLFAPTPPDWLGLVDAANKISAGLDPYVGQTYAFRWSPLAAWLLVPFVTLGLPVWQLLHVASLLLRPRAFILASLVCFAFWVDVAMGNVVVFGFVLAYLALSGKRVGVIGFVVFALLVPRPLYIPLLVWLWLRHAELRPAMLLTAACVAVLTLATGYTASWFEILLSSTGDIANSTNMAPSALIGYAWIPIGVAASVWAFRRGWIGSASLLAAPYWLPYYFQMLLLDLVKWRDARGTPGRAS